MKKKKKKKKKLLKRIGIGVVLFLIVLISIPLFFSSKIADIVKNKVNNSVHASFDFSAADVSLLSNFPQATLTLEDISLINKAPFAGDTLFAAKQVELKLSIGELFKGADDPIAIKSLNVDAAVLSILVNEEGSANYDIAKDEGTATEITEEDSASGNFIFSMESYAISDATIRYEDAASKLVFELLEMQHTGTGDLSLEKSELDTQTEALISFEMDSTNYLNKHKIQLDALIGVDLAESKYSFLKNEALVNQLPLVFDGFIQLHEDHQEVDIRFKTPSTDFKNFLGVIPEAYSQNIDNVETTGNFAVNGNFNGIVDDTHIPKFNIKIKSDNASFKYPDLPKAVRSVYIDTDIVNATGITEDTYVDMKRLSFKIDEDHFNMTSRIANLLGNTQVNAHVDAIMNLAKLSQAYPMPEDLGLKGILNADVTTSFDMNSLEQKAYGNTKVEGQLGLKDFEYATEELLHPVQINTTSVSFTPQRVSLNEFDGKTGQTDFQAKGTIDNLLGFLFNDEKVEGNFDLRSDTFALADFMVEEDATATTESETSQDTETTTAPLESIKIPSFLDCTIKASANKVLYDNLTLENVSGNLVIKDEKAVLSNMTSAIFDGKLSFGGEVSTKKETPTFAMKLGMDDFKIGETFKALALFDALAPIANALRGRLDSDIEISGNLKDDLTPDLGSISGNVLAELLGASVDADKAKVLAGLSSKLSFIEPEKLNLKTLKTIFSFSDGQVKVNPFTVNYQDIAINVSGSHSFDKQLNYEMVLDVPAKYLGSEINGLIAKIDDKDLDKLTVPVKANIGGGYTNPMVQTDLTSGVKNLTAQLVEIQKQKLLNKGKDKATDLITGILGGNKKDSTATEGKNEVKETLKGLLGGGKKKDTAEKEEGAAKKIIGNLFGKKKKKKDTVQ
ncbi:AsmA family protein [Spongiimicrobium salis]|uniref:AsmA family protein n=1 Tax=Spongiimicrobium salis TaxID=1667022 RepID=UPI00374CF07F